MNSFRYGPRGTVTCIGTIKVDIDTRLEANRFQATDDIYEVAPVEVRAGGTAVNFATAARGVFKRVNVIGAIGEDGLTELLTAAVKATGATPMLQQCPDQPNAIVLTVRDAPNSDGTRSRILISS